MKTAYFCNNTRFINGQYKGDHTEVALFKYARENLGDIEAEKKWEIPFDSERKRMTTVQKSKTKNTSTAYTKGALESVLPLCNRLLMNGTEMSLSEAYKKLIIDAYHSLMDSGLRVLTFAYKEIEESDTGSGNIENNMVFTGLIGIEDPPRPEVPDAIRKCHEAGIKVIMITGDGSRTAWAIAKEIGLVKGNPVVIEGQDFEKMSDSELREKLAEKEIIFARMTPKHKMRVVSILKEEGERVAVTGDGVNDAPALKKADIWNCHGHFRIPLPLTIIQILAIDLGTDMLPALALGAEKPTRDLMRQPPKDPKERLLNFKLLSRAYLFLGPIEATAGLFGFFYVLESGGWQWGGMQALDNILYMQAATACLTAIIVTQVANVFACRSFRESLFSIGLFSNRLIFIGIAFEIMLQLLSSLG